MLIDSTGRRRDGAVCRARAGDRQLGAVGPSRRILAASPGSTPADLGRLKPDQPPTPVAGPATAASAAAGCPPEVTASVLAAALGLQQHELMLEDRARIAVALNDHVIQRLFAAGLNLHAVAGALGPGPLATRLQVTVDDLDDTIKQIRITVFDLQQKPPGQPQQPG